MHLSQRIEIERERYSAISLLETIANNSQSGLIDKLVIVKCFHLVHIKSNEKKKTSKDGAHQ